MSEGGGGELPTRSQPPHSHRYTRDSIIITQPNARELLLDELFCADPKLSEELYTKGCNLSHAPCCHNLAVLYKKGGAGVPPNPTLHTKYKNIAMSLIRTNLKSYDDKE